MKRQSEDRNSRNDSYFKPSREGRRSLGSGWKSLNCKKSQKNKKE